MQKINFQNLPSTTTPINATNLNAIQTNVENVFNGSEVAGSMVVESIRTKNMFDKNNVIGAYLDTSGNAISNTDHSVSNYIDVSGMSNVTVSGNTGTGIVNCFYDSSKGFISAITMSNNQATRTMAVPSNAKYIRVTVKNTVLNSYQLEEGSTATTYTPYQELDNKEKYTTGEQLIGTWIDGSNVYRKVITYTNSSTIGASGSVTNISIPHSTPNLSLLLNAKLIKGGYNFPTLSGGTSVNSSTSITQVTSTTINLRIINDTWGASTWYIVIEYVK